MFNPRTLLAVIAFGMVAATVPAQAPSTEYRVQIRYEITTFRNERIVQFREMVEGLQSLGFKKDPGPDDEAANPSLTRLTGTIASASAARSLVRNRHVMTVLIIPKAAQLPAENDPVRVDLELRGSVSPNQQKILNGEEAPTRDTMTFALQALARQRVLADQVRVVLKPLGYRDGIGYDNRDHVRLLGMMPAGKLDFLLDDLRKVGSIASGNLDPLLDNLNNLAGSTNPARFKVTPQSLAGLRSDGVSDPIVSVLEKLLGQEFDTEKSFIDTVEKTVLTEFGRFYRADELVRYQKEIQSYQTALLNRGAIVPTPLVTRWPLAFVEVMPAGPFPVERPVPLLPPKGQEQITPELRGLLADEAEAAKPRRMEVILSRTPTAFDRNWLRLLQANADVLIEGRLGPVVTLLGPTNQAITLSGLPFVSTVRLPRSGQPRLLPPVAVIDSKELLRASGIEKLHQLGRKGKGHRVAIIDGDFRGWQEQVGKDLPAKTSFLDLTAERNRDLQPDAFVGDPMEQGHGTRCAIIAAKAAPEAQLTLIRVDPQAPYQLQVIARAINGDLARSEALDLRKEEIDVDQGRIEGQGQRLVAERQRLLENPAFVPDFEKVWADFLKRKAAHDKEEAIFQVRFERWIRLSADLLGLRGVDVVASPLVWPEGHPVDGSGALSRYFDDRPFKAALWFQSAGDTRGQSWSGPFRDVDGNGVMEFAAPGTRLNKDRWSDELNFLAWQEPGKAQTLDLPANATVRVSIQWREVHDPDFWRHGEDVYRQPLADMQLQVLKQIDPTGKKQPIDDLEFVAESVSLPQRLDNLPASATYEQTVQFTTKEAGRFVLRVEGRQPRGTRPANEPTLPLVEKLWELKPRVFVETLDGPGRAVFADYAPLQGNLGMPGDAHFVITVGAATKDDKVQAQSGSGPPQNMELLVKPDALAYGEASLQATSGAVSLSAGLAATAMSAGTPKCDLLDWARIRPGGVLRVRTDKDR